MGHDQWQQIYSALTLILREDTEQSGGTGGEQAGAEFGSARARDL